jgi:hypothetical protein
MVHLAAQARMAGPIHFRSMWPVERFLKKCKGYVRTKSHPEGSIMEGAMFEDALTFYKMRVALATELEIMVCCPQKFPRQLHSFIKWVKDWLESVL